MNDIKRRIKIFLCPHHISDKDILTIEGNSVDDLTGEFLMRTARVEV